ncbi:hypothetical protein [Streptomyces sp. NPDC054804]
MTDPARATAVPGWVPKFMEAVDTLDFGEGFAPLTEDTDMCFGTAHIHGVEAIKAFFVKFDAPLDITHEAWSTGPPATASDCFVARRPWPRRARITAASLSSSISKSASSGVKRCRVRRSVSR